MGSTDMSRFIEMLLDFHVDFQHKYDVESAEQEHVVALPAVVGPGPKAIFRFNHYGEFSRMSVVTGRDHA
jgi:hypothetical protein